MGKAFQNYRRTTLNRLEQARKVARLLKLWRLAASAGRAGNNVNVALDDIIWSDDNMMAFVMRHVNYKAMVRWRAQQEGAVKARLLPPSLIDLWRFALVAQHSAWESRYLPDVDPNHFVREPPPVWVERGGGEHQPPAVQQRIWEAASAASSSAAAASAAGSSAAAPEAALPGPRPSTLADLLEGKLGLAIAKQHPALG